QRPAGRPGLGLARRQQRQRRAEPARLFRPQRQDLPVRVVDPPLQQQPLPGDEAGGEIQRRWRLRPGRCLGQAEQDRGRALQLGDAVLAGAGLEGQDGHQLVLLQHADLGPPRGEADAQQQRGADLLRQLQDPLGAPAAAVMPVDGQLPPVPARLDVQDDLPAQPVVHAAQIEKIIVLEKDLLHRATLDHDLVGRRGQGGFMRSGGHAELCRWGGRAVGGTVRAPIRMWS
ncbi:hypothetical protein HMPREF0731_4527, partial [Pseudoroseomonas cervicalis ATCC 49957]